VQEQERKKEEHLNKRNMVKETLDKQLKEQEKVRLKIVAYNKRMDNVMLHNDRKHVEQEKR